MKLRQTRKVLELNKEEKELVFVKLGGSAITFKDTPNKANTEVLNRVSEEIAQVSNDYKILIGHGGGSFPHPVAEKYKVQEGLEKCGAEGFTETQRAARTLNQIVLESLIENKVHAVPVQTSACTMASNGEIKEIHIHPLEEFIRLNLVPVIYGDVVVDETKGCTIVSTEMILKYLAHKLKPSRLILGTDVDGVFTVDPKKGEGTLIKEINEKNYKEVMQSVEKAKTTDVTGGMAHKVQELYNLSKLNIEIQIINLLKKDYLKRAIQGDTNLGTTIKFITDEK